MVKLPFDMYLSTFDADHRRRWCGLAICAAHVHETYLTATMTVMSMTLSTIHEWVTDHRDR